MQKVELSRPEKSLGEWHGASNIHLVAEPDQRAAPLTLVHNIVNLLCYIHTGFYGLTGTTTTTGLRPKLFAMTSPSASSQATAIAPSTPLGPSDSAPLPRTQEHVTEYHEFIRTLKQDAPSTSAAAVHFNPSQAPHAIHSVAQEYPPTPLTFFDASPTPASRTPSAPIVPATPTPPVPALQRTSVYSNPLFNANELREIFPAELPPRPPQKRGFFARMFKRQQRPEDIELGHTPESHRLRNCEYWLDRLSSCEYWLSSRRDKLIWWGLFGLVVVAIVISMVLTKGHGYARGNNWQW
jgi:hypothetical protein